MQYPFELAADERRELLRIARATLREWVDSGRMPPGKPHRASLVAPARVEVVLTGSEGAFRAVSDDERPLYRAIQEAIVAAARSYPRQLDDLATDGIAIAIAVGVDPAQAFADPHPAT